MFHEKKSVIHQEAQEAQRHPDRFHEKKSVIGSGLKFSSNLIIFVP